VGSSTEAVPHIRLYNSNFGSRIDCYAWGEFVDTCSSDPLGSTTLYTPGFNGTSAASAIVAGAALSVQGMAEANLGYRFGPKQLRTLLSDPANGTVSNNPAADRIGVMPDLGKIVTNDALALAPDVYLRDFVGDVGDPHSGLASASPDVILVGATLANPQLTFGEGSGTENSSTLGSVASPGQDNFIYVRVRNRGGSAATNLAATVYWSPPATLVTPDLWTLVGSATVPTVPTGDLLTVSNAIVWPAAAIPGLGHYCFVALVGNPSDPAPDPTDLRDWNNFLRFIRSNNNVTWRNFNVVSNVAGPRSGGFLPLPFLMPGAPDQARMMQLEVACRLPEGAEAWLEMPLYLLDVLGEHSPFVKLDPDHGTGRVRVNPHGRKRFGEAPLARRSKTRLSLHVRIPAQLRNAPYQISARQLYQDQEVGRVTWVLSPPDGGQKVPLKRRGSRSRK
jgi:hypothetical protein